MIAHYNAASRAVGLDRHRNRCKINQDGHRLDTHAIMPARRRLPSTSTASASSDLSSATILPDAGYRHSPMTMAKALSDQPRVTPEMLRLMSALQTAGKVIAAKVLGMLSRYEKSNTLMPICCVCHHLPRSQGRALMGCMGCMGWRQITVGGDWTEMPQRSWMSFR